ncbi:PqqD family protein [Staphylococcus hominis]|uniref:PqqD family protein n=1 Tax=Staphylococcus hominis TaxID=1290 RepID=UPI0034D67887
MTNSTKIKYEILTFCSHINADLLPLMSKMSFSNSFRSPNKKDIGEIGITQLNETLSLLDNILNNPTSELFYSLALENNSKADIVNIVSRKFNIDVNVIKKDVDEFFAQIHPNSLYTETLKNAQ